MREEKIHDALNFLDDDMIEQVDKLRSTGGKRKIYWMKGLAVAACLCLVLSGIFVYDIFKYRGNPNGDGDIVVNDKESGPQYGGNQGDWGLLFGSDSQQELKFPRVMVEILDWEDGRFVGKIIARKDTDIFEIGSDISIFWEDYIVLAAYTQGYEKYLYRKYGAPTQEQFPVGSIVMVDVDSYNVKNDDVPYEVYTECIAYVEE